MAISIDWKNKIINVPRADMLLIQTVPSEIRQLDIDAFRLVLKNLEDDAEGMAFLDTHRHNTTVTVGGAVLARVVEIINSYTVTFEDGQYAVNLVGANSNIGDVTNVNQVSVRSSNSAGLQDLNSLQAASFANSVTIKAGSPYSGTLFPVGTRQYPVNNIADAVTIATNRGMKNIAVASDFALGAGDSAPGFRFVGDSVVTGMFIDGYANVTGCEFNLLSLSGALGEGALVRECQIGDIIFRSGILYESGLYGTIQAQGTTSGIILECFSISGDIAVGQLPAIDFSQVQADMTIRGYNGILHAASLTDGYNISLDFDAGILHILPSCTAGQFVVKGIADIENGGASTVIDRTVQSVVPANTWNKTVSNISAPGSIGEKIRKNLPR
jgi:hypothetical protein